MVCNMAGENGVNGGTPQEHEETTLKNQVEEKSSGTNGDHQASDKSNGDEKNEKIPFFKLFSFADKTDYILMLFGTIGAIGNGSCMPLMTILFGEMINSFGNNQNNTDIVSVVSKVKLCYTSLDLILITRKTFSLTFSVTL